MEIIYNFHIEFKQFHSFIESQAVINIFDSKIDSNLKNNLKDPYSLQNINQYVQDIFIFAMFSATLNKIFYFVLSLL